MESIINPWIFYFIDVLSTLEKILFTICFFSAIVSVVVYIMKWTSECSLVDYEKKIWERK